MKVLFLIVAALIAFYVYVYRTWDYKKKFNCKMALIYVSLGLFLLCLVIAVQTVGIVYEEEQSKTLAARTDRIQYEINRGDYSDLASSMQYDADYEPEFEYLWERLSMYECCNRYLIFTKAKERLPAEGYEEKAGEYKEMLSALCENPKYAENKAYGEYYLRQAGLLPQEGN